MKLLLSLTISLLLLSVTCRAQFQAATGTAGRTVLTHIGDTVGIGTNSPGLKAHIVGALGWPVNSGTAQTGVLRLQAASSNGVLDFSLNGLSGASLQATALNNLSSHIPLVFNPNGGNVGVGTTSPQAKFHIVGATEGIRLTGAGTSGIASQSSITFFDSDNATRRGFIGDGSSSNLDMYFVADAGGGLNFGSGGTASRMFIDPSGNVGIGTATPARALDINGFVQTNSGAVFNNGKAWDISLNGSKLAFGETGVAVRMAFAPGGNIGIGTMNPDQLLTVNGTVHSTAVVVDATVPAPDYVFNSDYNLRSLSEVKTYVEKNHHLPEVPSAAELEKSGLDLGKMNTLLLKKVEELTLYVIKLDKTVHAQQKEIKKLKSRRQKKS